MSELLEYSKTGRARCKLCKETIAKDALRMGIITPGFAFDGDMTSWHHAICAAGRRPVPMMRALAGAKSNKALELPTVTKSVLESLAKLAHKHQVKQYVWRHPTKERCLVALAGEQFALFTDVGEKPLAVEGTLEHVLASVPDEDFGAAVAASKNVKVSAAKFLKKVDAGKEKPAPTATKAKKKTATKVKAKKKAATKAKKKKATRR